MKTIVATADLKAALTHIGWVCEHKATIPILTCIKLTGDGGLMLHATDPDNHAKTEIDGQTDTPWSVCVDGKNLADAVKMIKDDTTTLSLDAKSLRLSIGNRTLPATKPDEIYDLPPRKTGGARMIVDYSTYREIHRKVRFAISTEETRHYLCGIAIQMLQDTADSPLMPHAIATDGHRMAVLPFHAQVFGNWSKDHADAIFPTLLVDGLAAIVGKKGEGLLEIELTPGNHPFVIVRTGRVCIGARLIDGTYPEWQRVVPVKNPSIVGFVRAEFLDALADIKLNVKTQIVSLDFDALSTEISSSSVENGSASATITSAVNGPVPPRISFTRQYLIDILSRIDGESVTIEIGDNLSSVLIHGENRDYRTVLMPCGV